jgi:hypothetical protein
MGLKYKTTKKDLNIFQLECKKWIKHFGLLDWEVHYFIDEDDDDSRGCCVASSENGITSIFLNRHWEDKPKQAELRKVAFHEVWELILSPYRLLAESRYATGRELERERHRIIRILENTIWEVK